MSRSKFGGSMNLDEFDPRNITQAHMNKLATAIRTYIELMEDCAVFPSDMSNKVVKQYQAAIKRAKKLLDKLEQGDRSVFKDEEEWNPLV